MTPDYEARIKELEEINRQYVNALEREKTLCAKEWEYSQEHIKKLIAEVERLQANQRCLICNPSSASEVNAQHFHQG